jgi:hypothetical protein
MGNKSGLGSRACPSSVDWYVEELGTGTLRICLVRNRSYGRWHHIAARDKASLCGERETERERTEGSCGLEGEVGEGGDA